MTRLRGAGDDDEPAQRALADIVVLQAENGDFEGALETLATIGARHEIPETIARLAAVRARAGLEPDRSVNFDAAIELADTIWHPGGAGLTIGGIALALLDAGEHERALQLVEQEADILRDRAPRETIRRFALVHA